MTRRPLPPRLFLAALLALPALALTIAGCGPDVEDGPLPAAESSYTPEQEQELMMDSGAAGKMTE